MKFETVYARTEVQKFLNGGCDLVIVNRPIDEGEIRWDFYVITRDGQIATAPITSGFGGEIKKSEPFSELPNTHVFFVRTTQGQRSAGVAPYALLTDYRWHLQKILS